ncbi:MAG: hypothetical protein ACTS8H_03120 [Arsenophonus sp. NC-PE1-MAG3]
MNCNLVQVPESLPVPILDKYRKTITLPDDLIELNEVIFAKFFSILTSKAHRYMLKTTQLY